MVFHTRFITALHGSPQLLAERGGVLQLLRSLSCCSRVDEKKERGALPSRTVVLSAPEEGASRVLPEG